MPLDDKLDPLNTMRNARLFLGDPSLRVLWAEQWGAPCLIN